MNAYKELLLKFLQKGYKTSFFSDNIEKKGSLIIRHDIDFDIDYTYKISLIEKELNVKSTFFFMLNTKSYNIFEESNFQKITEIKKNGNVVSLHFDPTVYQDVQKGLEKEKTIFEQLFDVKVDIISIHRPDEIFLNDSEKLFGVKHTYEPRYFSEIKYFSDSQGDFKYGHPVFSDAFANLDTIQLLIHPLWWIQNNSSPLDTIEQFLEYRIKKYKEHIAKNCKIYKL